MDLGLARRQLGEHAPEPQRLVAQVRARPVVAGGRRVALVEDEVDDLEHRGEARRELVAAGHLERHVRFRERALGAHDALRDGRLRDEEGARDLGRGEAAEQPQRERDPRLGGEHRVAAGEHEAEQVVADVVDLERARLGGERDLELAHELLLLALERRAAAQRVDRAVLGGGHQPGARVVRDARPRPRLQRGDERVLREVLGEADVAHDPRQPGDQPRRLDPPDRVDRALRDGHGCACSFHAAWTSGPWSSISKTCRTSITSPSLIGAREAHSTASSLDLTSISQ